MSNIFKQGTILAALLLVIPVHAIDITEEPPTPEQQFKSFILEVAEKDSIAASDYQEITSQTIALATPAKESGKPLADSIIHDALSAVEAGRELNPLATDWGQLENALTALLEKPPEQEQQDQQQSDEQNEENSEENQDQQGDDSKNSEQQEGESGEEDQQQEGQDGEQQNSSEQGKDGEQQEQNEPQQGGSKMGDLDEEQPEEQEASASEGEEEAEPEASEQQQQQQQQQQEDMQSIGGQQQAPQQVDGDKAVILQKLEQLKQQDDPAKLFQILQQAESGEKADQPTTDQDW